MFHLSDRLLLNIPFWVTFKSTLHLPWPPSETPWTATEASKLLQPFHSSVSVNFNGPLYPRTSHQLYFFVFSFIASPSFYPSSVLSASTPLTSPPPPSPFIVSLYPNHHPSFPFRNRMTPLPFIKLAYASDTAQAGEWGEKKGEVMWEARERSFRSTPEAHLRPSLKPGLLLLPFVSSSLFSLSTVSVHQGKLWKKKKKEGDYAQGR